jgi:hypothetical protein
LARERLTREPNDGFQSEDKLQLSLGSAATQYHTKRKSQDGSTAEGMNSWVPRTRKMTAAYLSTGDLAGCHSQHLIASSANTQSPKGCGGMYISHHGAVDGCIASAKGGAGQGQLEGGAEHRSASSANQRPFSEDGLASLGDATFDTASGRQRRIFDLSVAVQCDRRLTAVASRGKGVSRGGRVCIIGPAQETSRLQPAGTVVDWVASPVKRLATTATWV